MHEVECSIASGVDWGIHLGHTGKERKGPLQAFNVSEPVWFDGLTKNERIKSKETWLQNLELFTRSSLHSKACNHTSR